MNCKHCGKPMTEYIPAGTPKQPVVHICETFGCPREGLVVG